MFHHDPDHADDFLSRVEEQVQAIQPASLLAREGMVLRLDEDDRHASHTSRV
jgi:hypothetical protein